MFKYLKYALFFIILLSMSIDVFAIGRIRSPKPEAAASSDAVASPKTTNIPGMIGVYTANGTSVILKGLMGSNSDTVNILFQFPNGVPTPGDTFVMGAPLTNQTLPNGQSGTVIPMIYQASVGGGTISITESSTVPDFAAMSTGDLIICESNGDWYYKSAHRRYTLPGTVTIDPDTVVPIITITTPAADGSWVQSTTYTALQGTASDDIQAIVGWCLDGTSYAPTGVTQSGTVGSITWSVSSITLVEGLNTIYMTAGDGTGQGYDTVTINVDTVNPVTGAGVDQTHPGTGVNISVPVTVTESNESVRQYYLYNTTTSTMVTNWTTFTGSTASVAIPANTNDYRIDIRVTDLSGRTGTDSLNVTYAAGSGGTVVTDTFGGTENPLSTDWVTFTTTNSYAGMKENSGYADGVSATVCASMWNSNTFTNNQYAKITIGDGVYAGVMVRANTDGAYVATVNPDNARVRIYRHDNATNIDTSMQQGGGTWLSTSCPDGATLELRMVGSSFTLLINGVSVGTWVTDTTYASGRPGITNYGPQVNAILDFEAGDIP